MSSTRRRRLSGCSSASVVCRSKIVVRMSRTVSSSCPTTPCTRRRTSGSPTRGSTDCRASPAANTRWITRSCRSRAIRSRSSYTSSCRASRCRAALSRADRRLVGERADQRGDRRVEGRRAGPPGHDQHGVLGVPRPAAGRRCAGPRRCRTGRRTAAALRSSVTTESAASTAASTGLLARRRAANRPGRPSPAPLWARTR